jgi:hypothetical protein
MIHQLKCPALRDTVPEMCYSNVNYLENFEKICGPSKLLMVLLLAKLKNLQISSSLPCIMSPNPGVEITLFLVKYYLRRFLNNAHKHKQIQ